MDISGTVDKVKLLASALMGGNPKPMPVRPAPSIPQNGLANQAQQKLQNRGTQLNKQIDDAS
jgi:hypothetical protein